MSYHLCSDKCFLKRNANKCKVKCMHCDLFFNLSCFNITASDQIKFINSNLNINFVCDKCIEKCQRNKQSNRRSTPFNKRRLSATSLENENEPDKNNESSSPSSLTSADKSNSINGMTIEAEPLDNNSISQPKSSDAALHNAFTHDTNQSPESFSNSHSINDNNSNILLMLNTIMQKIDSLDTQINKNNQRAHNETNNKVAGKLDSLHSALNEQACDYERIEQIIRTHACNNKIFTRNSIGGSGTNFAEWSFSLNNSINNQTNVDSNGDLYQLLHSLESNSWSAFDHITKTVNKIADAIKIDNFDRDTIRSPLTESIQIGLSA